MRLALLFMAVCAAPLAAQQPKPDTTKVIIYRSHGGSRTPFDSARIHALAIEQSSKPDSAFIRRITVRGDTATVRLYTIDWSHPVYEGELLFVRRDGRWTLVSPPRRPR